MNLSRHSFSIPEYSIFNKNLNFCPTPGTCKSSILKADLHDFTRKIKLRAHFDTKTDKNNEENNVQERTFYIKGNSTWQTKDNHHTVKTFVDALQKEFDNIPRSLTTHKQNLTKDERTALKELQTRDDIIITNADKGGAVVIQDVDNYITESYRQLNDDTFYQKQTFDLTSRHNKQVNDTIESLQQSQLLDTKTANMLKTSDQKNT